jgi:hypothetical protein
MSASTGSNTVVTQLVETLRALAGSHPGFRAAHAKGIKPWHHVLEAR